MRDAVNPLATFRFFAVVIVVMLATVLESRETQQASLVVLATIARVISLVIMASGRTLVVHPNPCTGYLSWKPFCRPPESSLEAAWTVLF
jgi:hypothetical protein